MRKFWTIYAYACIALAGLCFGYGLWLHGALNLLGGCALLYVTDKKYSVSK